MVALQLGSDGAGPLAVGHTGGIHDGVGNGFVHADSAAQHAAAHVRDAGQFKQALDGAILAVFAVHDGSADVDVDQLGLAVLQQPDAVVGAVGAEDAGGAVGTLLPAAVGHGLGRGTTGQPAALLGDAHGEHLVSIGTGGLCQGAQPGRGRNTADLVLTGYAAEKQRNAQFFSFVHSRKTPQQLYTDTLQVFSLL